MDLQLRLKPYTKLRRLHCEQWHTLMLSEIDARYLLCIKHRREWLDFKRLTYTETAMAIARQVSEIIEFNAINSDKRSRLQQQQWEDFQLLHATPSLK